LRSPLLSFSCGGPYHFLQRDPLFPAQSIFFTFHPFVLSLFPLSFAATQGNPSNLRSGEVTCLFRFFSELRSFCRFRLPLIFKQFSDIFSPPAVFQEPCVLYNRYGISNPSDLARSPQTTFSPLFSPTQSFPPGRFPLPFHNTVLLPPPGQ